MAADYYEILGLKKGAKTEEIKQAYLEKAKKYHPDVNHSERSGDFFLVVQEAFDTLKDKDKRKLYDYELEKEEFGVPLIRYKMIPSCREIPRLKEEQLIYLLLEIECFKQMDEVKEPQAHICLVLDQSTSMKGARMDMVKANISRLLSNLSHRDLFSIITFSDEAQIVLPPTLVEDATLIDTKVSLITASGGTEIKKGLKAGIDLLWQGKDDRFTRYLILLTDGHTYGDEEECYRLAKKAAKQGIKVSALGIGNEWNDEFLDRLSSITGGTSFYVRTKEDLSHYLENICDSLDNVYAQNMSLFLEENDLFELRSFYQLDPEIIQFSNFDQNIYIGDLLYKKKSVYLMEFLMHPLTKGVRDVDLLRGSIKMQLPTDDGKLARLFPELTLSVVDKTEVENPPPEIVRALSQINFFDMEEQTRKDVQAGNYVQASRRLHYLGTHLINAGEVQLASKIFSESESISKNHRFSPTGEKEIKYGTKRLLGMINS